MADGKLWTNGEIHMIVHPIEPVFDKQSRILILGSFPSVKSREEGFFYGHPQNRFWRVISAVVGADIPLSNDEKRELLLRSKIALWDVIASCDIVGSSDSSIRNVAASDLSAILNNAAIEKIFVNGRTALKYYKEYSEPLTNRPAVCLPSTSPANAAWKTDDLIAEWKRLIRYEKQ